MENKKTAVFGIYTTTNQAEAAVNQLMSQGFSGDDISVLMEDSNSSRQFAHEKNTKVPEGTTTGATAGGVIGGTLGLLAGLGALAIPGVGPLIAAGPIMGTLAGIGAGGTVGGLIGALVGALLQSITFVTGIKALLLIVAALYLLSLLAMPSRSLQKKPVGAEFAK